MSTKVLMSVEDYLRTSFDGADCEYVDGEIVERNMGELEHGDVQGTLYRLLWQFRRRLGIRVAPEVRIRVNPRRYRIPDVSVWRDDNIGSRIPEVPPFIAIEVLSPEDRMVRMLPKIQEYLAFGVEYVWLIDPYEKSAIAYSKDNRAGQVVDVLKTQNPEIEIPLTDVFSLNS